MPALRIAAVREVPARARAKMIQWRVSAARARCNTESMAKRVHAPVSEGQRLLVALRLSQRDIGAAVGKSHAAVQRWLSGVTMPPYDARLKLQEVLGVDLKTWELAPEPQTVGEAFAGALRTRVEAITAVAEATADKPLPDAVEGLEELIQQCRTARLVADVAPTILARIGAIEVRAIAEREKLRGAVEIALRSPEARAIADAIHDSPLELCAVIDALENLEDRASFRLEDVKRDHPVEAQAVTDANAALVAAMMARASKRAA
jgi:transcriptional regulator with XRE-family HTH domain